MGKVQLTSLRKQEKIDAAVTQAFDEWRAGVIEYILRNKLNTLSEIPGVYDETRKVNYDDLLKVLDVAEANTKYYVKQALLSI